MAAFTTAILVGAAVVGAAAAVDQANSARQAGRAQRRAIAAEQRRADVINARERRAVVRNARLAQASIESQAALTGMTGSSAARGSISSVRSRLGENLSFLDQMIQLSQQGSAANAEAARWQTRMATAGAIGNLTKQVAGVYGGGAPTPVGG